VFCLFDMNCSVVLGHQEGIDNAKHREFHSNHYGFSFIFPLSMFTPPFSPYPPITTSLCPEWIQYSQSDSSMALFHLLFSFPISFIHRYTHSLPRNYSLHSILTSQFITSHITQIMDIVTDPVCRNRVYSSLLSSFRNSCEFISFNSVNKILISLYPSFYSPLFSLSIPSTSDQLDATTNQRQLSIHSKDPIDCCQSNRLPIHLLGNQL